MELNQGSGHPEPYLGSVFCSLWSFSVTEGGLLAHCDLVQGWVWCVVSWCCTFGTLLNEMTHALLCSQKKNHSTSSFDQEAMRHISEENKLQ